MHESFDWRLQAVTEVEHVPDSKTQLQPSDRSTIVSASPIPVSDGRTLVLPLPNATALMLQASKRANDDAQHLLARATRRSSGFAHMHSDTEAVEVSMDNRIAPVAVCTCWRAAMASEGRPSRGAARLRLAVADAFAARFTTKWCKQGQCFVTMYRCGSRARSLIGSGRSSSPSAGAIPMAPAQPSKPASFDTVNTRF